MFKYFDNYCPKEAFLGGRFRGHKPPLPPPKTPSKKVLIDSPYPEERLNVWLNEIMKYERKLKPLLHLKLTQNQVKVKLSSQTL